MAFRPIILARPIAVDRVVTVHYFEYSSSYYFEGERHDFWEFLYVDKGEVDVIAGDVRHTLRRGQLIFHAPGEFHALRANGVVAPNLVVVSFCCASTDMDFFRGKILPAGDAERSLLGRIVAEGQAAFSTPLDDPATTAMERSAAAPFAAEQLLGAALEELLIRLVRRGEAPPPTPPSVIHATGLEEVCRDNLVGRSRLQQVFRERTGGGVMEFFGSLKIEAAKGLIREGRKNFTEIAGELGYQSIYYFSRHFKKATGMSPSEYASSVKLLSSKTRPGE